MHTLSKLVVCAVMLRGRHRGLPVALDRAVLLPSEFLSTDSESPASESAHATHYAPPAALHTTQFPLAHVDAEVDEKWERGRDSVIDVPRPLQAQDPEGLAVRMRMRTSSATDRDSHPCNYVNAERARITMTMTSSP